MITIMLYSTSACSEAIDKYSSAGGTIHVIAEGTLGHGLTVLEAPKDSNLWPYIIIKEKAINEWNSAHIIRRQKNRPSILNK